MKKFILISLFSAASALAANAAFNTTALTGGGGTTYYVDSWTSVSNTISSLSSDNAELFTDTTTLDKSWVITFTLSEASTNSNSSARRIVSTATNTTASPIKENGYTFLYTASTNTVGFYAPVTGNQQAWDLALAITPGTTVSVGYVAYSSSQGFFFIQSGSSYAATSLQTIDSAYRSYTQLTSGDAGTRLWTNSGNEIFSNISVSSTGYATTTRPVPEPSMFGLFAGTLALGLAGTRRRRKSSAGTQK